MAELRKLPGMRERAPGVWEVIVEAGRDPLTGRRRQVSRTIQGTVREAKKMRAELLTEAGLGQHSGADATVDYLHREWLRELARKGRSPSTIHGYETSYRRNIAPGLGSVQVRKVNTKMLTDLYGAHQARGLKPATVYQIHACLSSMFTQACKWGWRDTNPAQWADPPSRPNLVPVIPTAEQVTALIEEATHSRRPEYARAIFIAATTGVRRGELCAIRCVRDIDWDASALMVGHSIIHVPHTEAGEHPTKNRRVRPVALDEFTLAMMRAQQDMVRLRAIEAGVSLVDDPFLFSDAVDGSEPWRPSMITRYFARMRERASLEHLSFHSLRRFMSTYGQDLGFSGSQVALRAGHDPSVAAKHYTGGIAETDRALARAVASLLVATAEGTA